MVRHAVRLDSPAGEWLKAFSHPAIVRVGGDIGRAALVADRRHDGADFGSEMSTIEAILPPEDLARKESDR